MDVNYELTVDYLVNFKRDSSLPCQHHWLTAKIKGDNKLTLVKDS